MNQHFPTLYSLFLAREWLMGSIREMCGLLGLPFTPILSPSSLQPSSLLSDGHLQPKLIFLLQDFVKATKVDHPQKHPKSFLLFLLILHSVLSVTKSTIGDSFIKCFTAAESSNLKYWYPNISTQSISHAQASSLQDPIPCVIL